MSGPDHWYNPYDRLAPFYDWIARTMLVPFGGERAFRRRVVRGLRLERGMRVLELGCGTGSMTREMLRAGAEVTAYDLSEAMLARARRRARGARFVRGDILEVAADETYDRVLLSFVLHEMDRPTRARALSVARGAIGPDGLVAVFDFAGGARPAVDRVFRAYLRVAEPEMAWELLDHGLDAELADAKLEVASRRHLAMGTTELLLCR